MRMGLKQYRQQRMSRGRSPRIPIDSKSDTKHFQFVSGSKKNLRLLRKF